MVAVWDDAVVELNKRSLDLKWIDANFGVWLSKTFGQDEVYILNERNEPLVSRHRPPNACPCAGI